MNEGMTSDAQERKGEDFGDESRGTKRKAGCGGETDQVRELERERVHRFTSGASRSRQATLVLPPVWLRLLRRAAILVATLLTLGCAVEADTTSSIRANFNGTPISGGNTLWFTSVLKASGLGSTPVTIFVRKSTITFSANGTNYTVSAPDVNITFSPSATTATIAFSATKNQWQLTVPSTGLAGNVLLNAAEYLVPQGGLPGGIQNVTWQANFSTDTAGISMQWQWAAAAYSSFSTDYNAIGVKPVDDNKASQYQNSNHAGTPENFESNVTGGATGGGGSNYTGSYSGTVSLTLPVVQPPTALIAGPSSGFVAQAISFNGLGSSDPSGYPLNYSWNFGDGATATGASATHTYSTAGTFTVSLAVDDGRNVTGSTTTTANIALPPPPTITATLSPAPNADGWNNTNVTVTFTCSDTNVGIVSCPSPVTLTAEGANQVAQGTAVNNAGVTTTISPKVSIDKTPPTIVASASPNSNSAGWNNTNVTVTFSCSDSRSGVARCPQPILISSSGANQTVSGTATDFAGNTSATATVTLNVELTLPSIAGSISPLPNAQGWNNTNVTVSFTCTQSTSSITSCPSPQTISTEGGAQTVPGTVTDAAGNSNTGNVNLSIAKTPPAITASIAPPPNGNGWNNSPVTVSFVCTRTTAPLLACPQPQNVTTEGANQPFSGTITDVAGNSAEATAHVSIATTPPTITASVSPQPNANGWNNSAVTVTFNCVATTAPIASCPQHRTISTEGPNQLIAGTATDVAGNSATTKVFLSIALTPPTITATPSPLPDANGWNNSTVTVSFDCTATTAPIATCPPQQTISTEGPGYPVSGTVTDVAGNSATANLKLNIGTKPPTIVPIPAPLPNAAGWNNSNVTVSFACAPGTAPILACQPPVTLTTEGPNQNVSGTATDEAGNSATISLGVKIDKTPPTVSYSISPVPNSNGINTTTPVTISFSCSDALSGVAVCPSSINVTTPGMNQVFTATVSDFAGNTATTTVTVNVQTAAPPSAPTITPTVSPAPNAAGWNNSDVIVSFTCAPGSNPLASCSSPVIVTAEGKNQSFCGQALDSTGLSATACATVSLDKTPPTITASQSPAASSSGWNITPVTVSFLCSDTLSTVATCTAQQTISANGYHQVVPGTAVDVAGNTASSQVTLNIDQAAPAILQFTTPTQMAPGQTGTATVNATDDVGVVSVVFQLNGTTIATLTGPPFTTSFTIPSTANSGDTVILTVVVSDAAGNANTSSRGIQVVLAGVVTGQVLSDTTGKSFPGASVQVIGGNGQDASDNAGRYSIPSNSSHLFLSISAAANASTGAPTMVTVEREVYLQNGVGIVPVDARLTPIANPTSINATGGSLTSGSVTITVAPGAVSSATNFYLTLFSQQGLPGLLPLGWSPTTAFDVRADTSTSASFTASITQLPSSLTLHLVRYDYSTHAWLMITPNVGAVNGTLTIPIPSVGDFALVTADVGNSAIVVPSSGQALAGVNMVALPAGSAATGSLNPPSVSPTGGTSVATLAVQSSVPLPSGTVIQANVQETYSLVSGKQLSDAKRTEDILLYQYSAPSGAAAVARFPVTPSQTFQPEQVSSGDVHLDILSGRESVRGQIGGSDAATVTGGDATLSIAAGSSPQDTAIAVTPEPVDGFLPATTSLIPLAEYNLDFSGQTLNVPAQLSVAAGGAQPGDNVLLAQIQRINGVPYLVVVSRAQVNGSTLVTQGAPGLSGLTQGGDYIFYKLTSPTGYVSGTVTASGSLVPAMVQTDGLPFVTFTGSSGSYLIPALAGTVNLSASVPKTAVAGSGTVQVTAGQTTTANLVVTGQTESATITPPNGSVGVPLTPEIDITVPDAFDQTSVLSTNVTLTQNAQGMNTLVPVRFVFSQGGSRLAVFPQSALQPSTTYTFAASGVANLLGGLIVVPTVTFTTQANTPPNFNTNALVFGMPDQNGNTQISAPANSFPPGTTILIVDQTNGVVLSLTVANDGSVTGQMPATIDDVLAVTVTSPDKTTATFTRSQFVAPDGTTAIGPGGGTVTGPGNTGIIIPAGALTKGATFKLNLLDQTAFPQLPSWPGANFSSGIQITAPAMPSFNKEAKLAFPVPANAPPGAFYYVYRRLVDPNDNTKVLFETIDHAFVQGTGSNAQVVTASPPFCGYMNSFGNFLAAAAASYQPLQTAITFTFMMWDYDPNQAGVASQGLLAGRVFQNDANGNPGPLPNRATATITLTDNPQYMTTTTPACGTYSLFDPQRGGGTRSLTATATVPTFDPSTGNTVTQKQTIVATSAEVNGIQPDDSIFSVTAGLEAQYRNIGRFNFTFAPATPPPPPPQINIRLFTLDANNNNLRVPVSGILQTGTQVVIAFKSNLTVQGASINGTPLTVIKPDVGDTINGVPEQRLLDARVQGLYPVGNPGTYTITASAEDPLTLAPVSVSISILVVAAGGGNSTVTSCAPIPPATAALCTLPQVVSVSPDNGATSVPPSVFPQVTFSEPVSNVSTANIVLKDSSGAMVPILFLGVRPDGSVADPVQPTDIVTSITIQPTFGLKFNQTYSLMLNAKNTNGCLDSNGNPYTTNAPDGTPLIVDTNKPPHGPLCMPPFPVLPSGSSAFLPYTFTTFGPQDLGGTASQYEVLTRPVIIGQRAYAGEFLGVVNSGVGTFDISNPANPQDLGVGASFIGRVIDAAGQQNSPVTGTGLLAFSAGAAEDLSIPGNVWLYGVPSDCANTQAPPTCPVPNRVGAVSVSSSATQAGIATRLVMKDNYLYTFTFLQGLQVIDLGQAISEYQQVYSTNPTQFGQAVSTEGDGFAMDAVVNTIPLATPSGGSYMMFGLAADAFATSSSGSATSTQTLLVATGQVPLVVGDPTLNGANAVVYPSGSLSTTPLQMTSADGQTTYQLLLGRAVALGTISMTDSSGNSTNKHIAVVVGSGRIGPTAGIGSASVVSVLAVIDVSQVYSTGQPFTPNLIGMLALVDQNGNPVSGTDVKLNGNVALVATGSNVVLVNLANPAAPTPAGQITGSFGNLLGLSDGGLLVSSSAGSSNGTLQIANTGPIFLINEVNPSTIDVDSTFKTIAPVHVKYTTGDFGVTGVTGTLNVMEDGNVVGTIPLPDMSPGIHSVDIPAGTPLNPSPEYVQLTLINNGVRSQAVVQRVDPTPNYAQSHPNGNYDSVSGLPLNTPLPAVTPDHISAGSGDTVFTVSVPAGTMQIWVRPFDGDNWATLGVSTSQNSAGTTLASVTVPGSLLQNPGLLQFSLASDGSSGSTNVLVADPTLPAFGTSNITQVSGGYPLDNPTDGASITMFGSGFSQGSKVVVGRNGVPGFILPTNFQASSLASGTLSAALPADDVLLVAGVAEPGMSAVSNAVPLFNSVGEYAGFDEFSDNDLADEYSTSDSDLLRVFGNLNLVPADSPNGPVGQTLTVYGVNLAPGASLELKTKSGNHEFIETVPITSIQNLGTAQSGPIAALMPPSLFGPTSLDPRTSGGGSSGPTTGKGSASPSSQTLKKRKQGVQGVASKNGQTLGQTPLATVSASGQFIIPFGGRRRFSVYKRGTDSSLQIVPDDRTPDTDYVATTATDNVKATLIGTNAQIEVEPSDPPGTFWVRGIQLTQSSVRPNCTVGSDQPALNLTVSGQPGYSLKAPKQVIVQYSTLGQGALPMMGSIDRECALISTANKYRVPPNILKAQIHQEGSDYNAAYRYEPSTIDFQKFTGDYTGADDVWKGQNRKITLLPWQLYSLGGPYLLAYKNPDDRAKYATNIVKFTSQPSIGQPFNLNSQVKVGRGRPVDDLPQDLQRLVTHPNVNAYYLSGGSSYATACINGNLASCVCLPPGAYGPPGPGCNPLTLVWNQSLWTKYGHNSCKTSEALPPAKGRGCNDPAQYPSGKLVTFSSTLAPGEFAVDYLNGLAMFGGTIQGNGDALVVRYEPIGNGISDAQPTPQSLVQGITTGTLVGSNPPNPGALQGGKRPYVYNPGETIGKFFTDNLGTNGSATVLTGTTSDKRIVFTTNAQGVPQQPADPRYSFTTAQYYAAATYGPLQVGLDFWYGSSGQQFAAAYDISKPNQQIWNLASQWAVAVDLGGKVHAENILAAKTCGVYGGGNCTADIWRNMWFGIVKSYNGQGDAAKNYANSILDAAYNDFNPR
jgi:PKD domain/Bacterial Ig-like domain